MLEMPTLYIWYCFYIYIYIIYIIYIYYIYIYIYNLYLYFDSLRNFDGLIWAKSVKIVCVPDVCANIYTTSKSFFISSQTFSFTLSSQTHGKQGLSKYSDWSSRLWKSFNPLSADPPKWPNTFNQLPTTCFSVFDRFAGLVLKGLERKEFLASFTGWKKG